MTSSIYSILKAIARRPVHFQTPAELRLKARISDIDINLHMNNSRYLKAMDLGRWLYIAQSGILKACVYKSWQAVAGAIDIRYLRSIKPFQKYRLVTRLECWQDEWWVLNQDFVVNDKIYAHAKVRMIFLDRNKYRVHPATVLSTIGQQEEHPLEASSSTKAWLKSLSLRQK